MELILPSPALSPFVESCGKMGFMGLEEKGRAGGRFPLAPCQKLFAQSQICPYRLKKSVDKGMGLKYKFLEQKWTL